MEKRAQQEHRAPTEAEKQQKHGAAASMVTAASAAYARRALSTGLPPAFLPPQAAWELAKEIGNSAFLGLLHPGRELLTATPPILTDTPGLDAYPIRTRPPALAQPLRLDTAIDSLAVFNLAGGMWGEGPGSPPFTASDMGGAYA